MEVAVKQNGVDSDSKTIIAIGIVLIVMVLSIWIASVYDRASTSTVHDVTHGEAIVIDRWGDTNVWR